MNANSPSSPIVFSETMEHPEDGEAQTVDELIATMRKIAEITYKDGGRGIRSVHAKSHGMFKGKLTVRGDLAPAFAQGLFATPGSYDVILRLSTSPGDILDDKVSTPRGMSMKVLGVPGERVAGSAGDATQDFIMINGPVFKSKTAKDFAKSVKLLASTTDKAEGLKIALSAALRGTEKLVEAVGGQSATLIAMGGHPETNPLGETYFTQVPLLYGKYMAKMSLAPATPALTSLKDAKVDLKDKPNGLREAVKAFAATQTAVWDLRVQLCTDLERMPIEDSTVLWKEEESPFVVVGQVQCDPQDSWPADADGQEDRLFFSPWHALAAHRPLGSIMRVRRAVYEASARFRADRDQVAVQEPSAPAAPDSNTPR